MEEWIVNTIINMITNVTSVGSDLIKTPEEFNATIYTGILNIQKNIINITYANALVEIQK